MKKDTNLDRILQEALENGSDGFVVYDKEGYLLTCNQIFRDLYGYTDEQASPGARAVDLFKIDAKNGNFAPGFDENRAEDFIRKRQSYSEKHNRNYELLLQNGRHIEIREWGTASGGTVSVHRDISAQKELENGLHQNAELFQAAFDADSNICSLSELNTGVFIDVNAAWCNTLGYSREEAIGKTAIELNIWKTSEYRQTIVNQIQKTPNTRDFQTEIQTRSGEIRVLSLNSEVLDANGMLSLYLSAKDITEELKVTKALQESQERLADFTKASSDWYWETDAQHRFAYISANVRKTTGIPPEDYMGLMLEEVTGPGSRNQKAFRILVDTMADRQAFRDIILYLFRRGTGEKLWIRVSGLPYFGEQGEFRGFRGSTSDITDQIGLEEKLQQSQKMEAVGQLTGGIAHDFNNLLAVIQGNAEMVKEVVEEGNPEMAHHLDAIMRASDRGAELTQNMLAFSRNQDLMPSVFRLDDHVTKMVNGVRRTLGENITVNTDFDKGLWDCRADPAKLESAFLNLCLNARDAMPEGGILTIELRNREVDESYAAMERDVVPGKYVSLIMSDTGCGISAERMPHIVEPFFTTKEVGKGAGLGLSMVYGFARQSKGHLSIYSEVDIGTTVRLLLPFSERDQAPPSERADFQRNNKIKNN